MRLKSALRFAAFAGFLGAIATVAVYCAGCLPAAKRASDALDIYGYQDALADCRAKGADAGSFDVYERCAEVADRTYGLDGGAP
jgi:hypothetical protein